MPKPVSNKLLRNSFAAIGVVLALIVTSLLVQPHWYKRAIEKLVANSGYQLQIGALHTRLSPLRLEISEVALSNPHWSEPGLLQVEALVLSVTGTPFGKEPFWQFDGRGLRLRVEQNESGSNWTLPGTTAAEPEETEPAAPALQLPGDLRFGQLRISDIELLLIDPQQQRQIVMQELSLKRLERGSAQLALQLSLAEQHFDVDGQLQLPATETDAATLALQLQHPGMQLSADATLTPAANFDGSALKLSATAANLDAFAAILNQEMPAFEALSFSTELSIGQQYRFQNTRLAIGDNALQADISIERDNLKSAIALRSSALNIDKLLDALPQSSGETPPTEAGEPVGEQPMDWTWLDSLDSEIVLELDALSVQGWQIEKLHSVLALNSKPGLILSMQQLVNDDTGLNGRDLELALLLKPLAASTTGADLKLESSLQMADGIQLVANGDINVNGTAGNILEAQLAAANSSALWKTLGLPYQEAGPLNLLARVSTRDNAFVGRLNTNLGKQRIKAQGTFVDTQRDRLQLNLQGADLDLRFMEAAETAAQTEQADAKPAQESPLLFDEQPLDLSALNSIDAEVALSISGLHTGVNHIERVELTPTLQNGHLQLRNAVIALPGNRIGIDLSLNAASPEVALNLQTKLDSDNIGALGLEELAGISGGHGDMELALSSKGKSSRALAANLQGKLSLMAQGMVADNGSLDLIGSDLISETLGKLNPFSKTDPNTHLQCVFVQFDGAQGLFSSDDNIVVETRKMKIVGTGDIDFGKEELSLNFSPIARKGLGVNLGGLAKLVRIGGTLKNPKPELDAGGALETTLSTGAAVYTGGLSLLAQSMIERTANRRSPCNPDAPPAEYDLPQFQPPPGTEPAAPVQAAPDSSTPASDAGESKTPPAP